MLECTQARHTAQTAAVIKIQVVHLDSRWRAEDIVPPVVCLNLALSHLGNIWLHVWLYNINTIFS